MIHRLVISPGTAFVFEVLPQNALLGTADLTTSCLQDMKQLFI